MVTLSHQPFSLQPNILNRILLWCIGSEANTGNFPLRRFESLIDRFKISPNLIGTMITGSIPQQCSRHWLKRYLRKAMVDSEFCFIGLNQTLLSAEINGSIVGLLAAFIDDGNFDALISFTPNIAAEIASRWHSSTKTTNCPETIWARWASNQSVISCLFF